MDRKYQIFISSTYEDLKDERDVIVKATREMGHIPVGMELFSAGDEEHWKVITREIDQSDFYVVVLAHRYGSTIDGVSYTEKEYDYAVLKGVPVMGFVISEGAPWANNKTDKDQNATAALTIFKEKVRGKPIGFWDNSDDLKALYTVALGKEIPNHERPGWVRGDQVADPEVINELSRLSGENKGLRNALEKAESISDVESHQAVARTLEFLESSEARGRIRAKDSTEYQDVPSQTLLQIFDYVSPSMVLEVADKQLSNVVALAYLTGSELEANQYDMSNFPFPSNWTDQLMCEFIALAGC